MGMVLPNLQEPLGSGFFKTKQNSSRCDKDMKDEKVDSKGLEKVAFAQGMLASAKALGQEHLKLESETGQ